MRPGLFAATASALLLAGCGDGGAPADEVGEANAAGAQETAEDYRRRIEALGEAQRNAVFIRAIRDAGRDCQHVESSAPRAPVNGAPAWTATCRGGAEWVVILGGGGHAQVTHAAELEAAGLAPGADSQTNATR